MPETIKYLSILIFVILFQQANAQYFYDQKEDEKEFVYSFYERGEHFSVFALGSPWVYKTGFAAMLHLNKDKVSPYLEYKTSLYDRYMVEGTDLSGSSNRQKEISYTQYTLASGCGFSFHRNFIIFLKGGVTVQQSLADSQIEDGFKYQFTKQGMMLNMGGGLAYVSGKYISLLIAGDVDTRAIYMGAGLTF